MGSKKKKPSKKKRLNKAERKAQRRHQKGTKAPGQGTAPRQEPKAKQVNLSGMKTGVSIVTASTEDS